MPAQGTVSQPVEDINFEDHAVAVLQELREAFIQLIESLPTRTDRAADLDKALGVSRTLGWQIHRIASSATPLEAGIHVPGMAAVQQVLRAARAVGTPQERLDAAERAMEAFELLVEHHAGDRATFATMLGSLTGRNGEGIDLKTRRQAFRLNGQVWGVDLRTYLACHLILPGSDPELLDVASITGLRGIRRLRSGAPFRLSTQRYFDAHYEAVRPEPIAEPSKGKPPGTRLLDEFCTQPMPQLEYRYDGRLMHTYLRETPLGNSGVLNLYFADMARGFRWKAPGEKRNSQLWFIAIRKPTESLVFDTLIHQDMFSEIGWETNVYGSLDRFEEPDPENFLPDETLPIRAAVLDLGLGPAALTTPHVPRYREIVEAVCRDIGKDPADFRLYRCIIEYPPLLSVVSLRFLLPEEGNW